MGQIERMRFVAAFLLLFAASPAWSQWTLMNEDADSRMYVDLETTQEIDGVRKGWLLVDYNEPTESGALSEMYITLFDCEKAEFRYWRSGEYSDHMATGAFLTGERSVGNNRASNSWSDIPTDSVGMDILARICGSVPSPIEV